MRYFLELAYNGKNYFGWQIQPNQISVQEKIEHCLSTILREKIAIIGAGRTDTGVHAKKMFAHFDFEKDLPNDLVQKLNSFLPQDIAIDAIYPMQNDAHARFDATSRTYHYFVQKGKNPFNPESTWQIRHELNFDLMNEAANLLIQKTDFGSFAKLHTDVKTHICDVTQAVWIDEGNGLLKFEITADRFLRNMVRAIVGTLVEVGQEKVNIERFKQIIDKKDRSFAGASAPAQGLFLVDVQYPKAIFES